MNILKISSLILCGLLAACSSTSTEFDNGQTGRSLREIVADKYPTNVYVGGTISYHALYKEKGDLLNREFSYITPANTYKQSYIHPSPGKWNWKNSDDWLKTAKENGQMVRLHAPISPQTSAWVREDIRTPAELDLMLAEYMIALTKRYSNHESVKWLDVVNESITEQGTWFGPKPGVKDWENPWTIMGFKTNISDKFPLLQKQGVPRYIIKAFYIAKLYAPDLKLILNQHRMTSPESIALMKELVLYLRHIGLRVDGIGWQAHLRNEFSDFADKEHQRLKVLDGLVKWAHNNQLEFHLTENEIFVKKETPYDADKVANAFTNILQVLLNNRETGVVGWNVWNISDVRHFQDKSLKTLGLWDGNLKPQKAFYQVQELLENN